MDHLEQLEIKHWEAPLSSDITANAIHALETGKVLYAPHLSFELTAREHTFLSPNCLSGKAKNLSFNPHTQRLGGTRQQGAELQALQAMLQRFSQQAQAFVFALLPHYKTKLNVGLASFRPAEIKDRITSWRKDDTRLHVDAFPSRPNQGQRILRIFCNVNPTTARLWRVGEPFEQVAKKFLPHIRAPFPGSAWLFNRIKLTKGRRTLYDHYMLNIHNAMKADKRYQTDVTQQAVSFPPGTTWLCYTDLVSHAAMSGQFAFEQTFYLPVENMQNPALAPLRVLERLKARVLV